MLWGIYEYMLTGIRIFTSDAVWRGILTDLNATVLDVATPTDLNMDDMDIKSSVSPLELKAIILGAGDDSKLLTKIFGHPVALPYVQARVVAALYKSGGMTSGELKSALGYASNTSTHVVDTAIYQLRRLFGREFIINSDGVYKIGRI